jgi:predicted esterase
MPPSTMDWIGRRVRVIHGDVDRRISAAYVKNAAQRLEASGADLVMYNYAEEDHFLFFRSLLRS